MDFFFRVRRRLDEQVKLGDALARHLELNSGQAQKQQLLGDYVRARPGELTLLLHQEHRPVRSHNHKHVVMLVAFGKTLGSRRCSGWGSAAVWGVREHGAGPGFAAAVPGAKSCAQQLLSSPQPGGTAKLRGTAASLCCTLLKHIG